MSLIQEAKLADKIGDAFTKFRDPNPGHSQDINATISALAGLSWAIYEVHKTLEGDSSLLDLVENDLKIVHQSIFYTLAHVWEILGHIGNGSDVLYEIDFQRTWSDIVQYCRAIGRESLSTRLDTYRRFLLAICAILNRKPTRTDEFGILRREVGSLSAPYTAGFLQDRPWKPAIDNEPQVIKKPSYDRQRPDREPLSPTDSNDSRPFFANPFPTHDRFFPNAQQAAPSPPTSPSNTFSSISQISSLDQEIQEHWAKSVFKDLSSTTLPLSTEPSRYHDQHDHPITSNPDDRYDEIVAMSFLPDLRASLHRRSGDMRTKMMVAVPASRGRTLYISQPIGKLYMRRSGCMLRFCHRSRDERSMVKWVSLQFSTIEKLVFFAYTFIAMRTASGAPPEHHLRLWDDQDRDEVEEYRGSIHDGKHRLELCIFRDKPSGSIRIFVCKRSGSLAGTPLWAAFVTHQISSPTWCEQVDRKVVMLKEMSPRIFKPKYEIEKGSNGAYIVEFESSSDTKAFLEIVAKIRSKLHRLDRR